MRRALAGVLLALAIVVASATLAFAVGHLSKHRAHQASMNHSERVCFHIDSCVSYGVVRCDRVNKRTVDCKEITEYKEGFKKSSCTQWAEWKLIQKSMSSTFAKPQCQKGWPK